MATRARQEAFEAPDLAEQPVHAETEQAPVEIDAKDQIIAARQREIEALHTTIAKKNGEIASFAESMKAQGDTIDAMQGQIDTLHGNLNEAKRDLGMARMAKQAAAIPQGLERLKNGGIRLAVELDQDEAEPLLSWANSAGEDPAVYIARQIKDALVMVVSS